MFFNYYLDTYNKINKTTEFFQNFKYFKVSISGDVV